MIHSFSNGSLFGALWGGEPSEVVALHGWRRSHVDFEASLGPNAPGRKFGVIALDLPGFGATPPPLRPFGSEDYAAAVARVLDEVLGSDRGKAVVVGHSLGGRVAVALAATRPDLVGSLVITGAPLLRRSGRAARVARGYRFLRRMNRMGLLGDALMEKARQRYGSADYRAAEGVMRDTLVKLLAESYEEWLSALACPVQLLWGEADEEAPVEVAEGIARLTPRSELTILAGVGHMVPIEAPAELKASVERAIQACR